MKKLTDKEKEIAEETLFKAKADTLKELEDHMGIDKLFNSLYAGTMSDYVEKTIFIQSGLTLNEMEQIGRTVYED